MDLQDCKLDLIKSFKHKNILMIKLIMRKTYLHNYTMINVDKEIETKKYIIYI